MQRLELCGGDLGRFVWTGAASNFKLILPGPGLGAGVLPREGDLQPVALDRGMLTVRTYTPRAWDPVTATLTVEVLLHGDGAVSRWAAAARPGAELAVTSALGRYDVDPTADWLVLAGDETALPAITTILEVRPPHVPTTVLVEVAGDDGRLDLGAGPSVDVRWIDRSGEPGEALAAALAGDGGVPPHGDGRVWVACEAHAMLGIRRQLLDERGLERRSVTTRGYWTSGRRSDDLDGAPPVSGSIWLR
jgi:NADPH-dependent ferric siderophore reductase